MPRYSPISLEQLRVLVDELFLLEVDQLAERHLQDRFGLHGRERVVLGDAAFVLELARSRRRPAPAAACAAGVLICISRFFGLGLRLRRADDADHFVDVGVREQQALRPCACAAAPGTAGTASAGG